MTISAFGAFESARPAQANDSDTGDAIDRMRSQVYSSLTHVEQPVSLSFPATDTRGDGQTLPRELVFNDPFSDGRRESKSAPGAGKSGDDLFQISDKKDEVVYKYYGFGPNGSGREWHKVTRGQYESDARAMAERAVNDVIKDINRHDSGTELRKDSEKLISALQHAKEHMSKEAFEKIIKDLPKRTGNTVYTDGNKLKLDVPWAWSNPVVYDPDKCTGVAYPFSALYFSIYD